MLLCLESLMEIVLFIEHNCYLSLPFYDLPRPSLKGRGGGSASRSDDWRVNAAKASFPLLSCSCGILLLAGTVQKVLFAR